MTRVRPRTVAARVALGGFLGLVVGWITAAATLGLYGYSYSAGRSSFVMFGPSGAQWFVFAALLLTPPNVLAGAIAGSASRPTGKATVIGLLIGFGWSVWFWGILGGFSWTATILGALPVALTAAFASVVTRAVFRRGQGKSSS
jgi:hypothetical protein